MRVIFLLTLVALGFAQQDVEVQQDIVAQAIPDQILIADNQVITIEEPAKRNDEAQPAIEEPITQPEAIQAIAPQAQAVKATPLPYPLYRQAYPYPTPSQLVYPNQELFREQPLPAFIQYVPVYIQAPEDPASLLSRQITANAGAHFGPFGGGFNAGLSPSGLHAGLGLGLGSQYTSYGYAQQRPTYSYYNYARNLPEAQIQQQPQLYQVYPL